MIIGHGGNRRSLSEKLGCSIDDIVDMSSNLNPLGPPDFIERVIRENLFRIKSLPAPDAEGMCRGFAAFHGIDPGRVVAGNGTTWFIYTLPRAMKSKQALILGPTYSDYRDACSMNHTQFNHLFLTAQNSFEPDPDAISKAADNSDLVFICNPNNPTGVLFDKTALAWLFKRHPDTVFVLDESYLPFVEGADEQSFVRDTRYENLIVLSSMSKIFRIPGLRTGFLSAPPAICDRIMAFYQPWSVNALAQAVIEYIFEHPQEIAPFYEKTREYITLEKSLFYDSLATVRGLKCFSSAAYFILAQLSNGYSAAQFCEKIGRHKILIRDCSNFDGLSERFVRFSLKHRPENEKLSGLIKEILNHA